MRIKTGEMPMTADEKSYVRDSPFQKRFPGEEDIRFFCDQYDIGDLVAVNGLLNGFLNANLKIRTTKGLYVVRILSGYGTVEHILYVERVIHALRKAGIPALVPLRTKEGVPFVRWQDRFVMVTPFVRGCAYRHQPRQAWASGAMLRKFHDTLAYMGRGPAPAWSNYPSGSILNEGLRRLQRIEDVSPSDLAQAQKLYATVIQQWHTLQGPLPETVIHGDWHLGNQIFTNGDVKCILDFDFVQWAERIHDVAYAVWSLMAKGDSLHIAKAFLNGYGMLEDVEVRAIPVAIARAAVFFVCTASFTIRPAEELRVQLATESPIIEYVLSEEGAREVQSLCISRESAA
jgi:Ser/Thr protein kinase RdoA (MazF antagonist)